MKRAFSFFHFHRHGPELLLQFFRQATPAFFQPARQNRFGQVRPLVASRNIMQTSIFACRDRKSTRLNSSHGYISYAVFCLKKKNTLTNSTVACSLPTWAHLATRTLSPRTLRRIAQRGVSKLPITLYPCLVRYIGHSNVVSH